MRRSARQALPFYNPMSTAARSVRGTRSRSRRGSRSGTPSLATATRLVRAHFVRRFRPTSRDTRCIHRGDHGTRAAEARADRNRRTRGNGGDAHDRMHALREHRSHAGRRSDRVGRPERRTRSRARETAAAAWLASILSLGLRAFRPRLSQQVRCRLQWC